MMSPQNRRPRIGPRLAFAFCLAAAWVFFAAFQDLCAGGKKSDSEVKVSATATKLDAAGKQVVTVTLEINKGWHVYANPVGNDDLEPTRTVVTVTGKAKPESVQIDYPPGKLTKDKVVGDYKVYEDKVSIQAKVQRAQGDTGPLEVSVRINACHEKGVCLLPATVKVTVP